MAKNNRLSVLAKDERANIDTKVKIRPMASIIELHELCWSAANKLFNTFRMNLKEKKNPKTVIRVISFLFSYSILKMLDQLNAGTTQASTKNTTTKIKVITT